MQHRFARVATGLLAAFGAAMLGLASCSDDGVGDRCAETKECKFGLVCSELTCKRPGDVRPPDAGLATDAAAVDAARDAAADTRVMDAARDAPVDVPPGDAPGDAPAEDASADGAADAPADANQDGSGSVDADEAQDASTLDDVGEAGP